MLFLLTPPYLRVFFQLAMFDYWRIYTVSLKMVHTRQNSDFIGNMIRKIMGFMRNLGPKKPDFFRHTKLCNRLALLHARCTRFLAQKQIIQPRDGNPDRDWWSQLGRSCYSYGHLLVITGYKWDYTFYK